VESQRESFEIIWQNPSFSNVCGSRRGGRTAAWNGLGNGAKRRSDTHPRRRGGLEGSKKVTISADAPIVTFAEATAADVKPGAHAFVPALRQTDGAMCASRVVVGKGVVPPM
jgi:hypothetical protein